LSAEESLQPEVHLAEPGNSAVSAAIAVLEDATAGLSPEVLAMMDRMMDGVEPVDRPLKTWEQVKFSPMHINICTLRAAGFKGSEISRIMGADQARISVTINHPYGRKLIKALVPQNAVRVIDIRTRLDEYASDLLDATFGLAMRSEDPEVVSKITFGILDRAGYAPKPPEHSGQVANQHGTASDTVMQRLAVAMEGSNAVNREVMPSWTPREPPEGPSGLSVGEAVGSSQESAPPGRVSGPQIVPEEK
jgi:hypothetical protein